jgi:hypothetical protein
MGITRINNNKVFDRLTLVRILLLCRDNNGWLEDTFYEGVSAVLKGDLQYYENKIK